MVYKDDKYCNNYILKLHSKENSSSFFEGTAKPFCTIYVWFKSSFFLLKGTAKP